MGPPIASRPGVGVRQARRRAAVQHQPGHVQLRVIGDVHGLHAAERDADRGSDPGDVKVRTHLADQRCELRRAERSDAGGAVSGP